MQKEANLLTFTVLHDTQRHRFRANQRERLRFDDELIHDGVQESRTLQKVERVEEVRERAHGAVIEDSCS